MSKSILGLIVALLLPLLTTRAAQPIFNISSLTDVTPGQIIDIDFHVDQFSQLVAVQFSVNWNPEVLDFRAVKNLNPSVTGLAPSSFNTTGFIDQGKFTLAWIEPGTNQITIPDGSLFFTVEFEVIGDPCQSSAVAITGDPTEIQASEDGKTDIGLVTHNGSVSIQGTGCSEDLIITGNSVVGNCGAQACVRFTVENFVDVGAMDFSVSYDPAVLQFDHFQNYAPLLSFGDGNTNMVAPGTLRVVWFNGNTVNESLPDGTTLFEVCFDVTGPGGSSSEITFGPGNDPDGQFFNIDGTPYIYTFQPALITSQCALQGFALIGDTVCTTPGGLACMDITVNDFEDIVALQFSMNWDTTKFVFDHLEGFNPVLEQLEASISTPQTSTYGEGVIAVSWLDPDLSGATLSDRSTIFTLCLRAIGPVGSSSPVVFSEVPIEIEISTLDSVLQFGLLQGLAEIKTACDTDVCSISYTLTPTSPSCPAGCNGSINLEVTLSPNCQDEPTYQWSVGNFSTEDISGLCPGAYTVTITLGTQVIIANATVQDVPPMSVTSQITDPNPPGTCTGAITLLTITGGTPSYTFHWSNNETTQNLTNLCAGVYTVTITDAHGCTFVPDPFIVGADISAVITRETCAGSANGSICITPSFGTPPYTYLWDTGATTPCLNNISSGIHCVTVTDSGGSTRDTCFTLQPQPALNVTASLVHDVNQNCHGAIDLNVTGGTPPYTYLWSNGLPTQDLVNLCPGLYCVTITYNNGACTFDTCFTITTGGIAVSLTAQQFGNFQTSCNGVCNGSITSNVTGGTSPFTYHWSNGFTTPNLSGVCAGVYSLTVTDANSQTAVSSITINSPPAITLSLITTLPTDVSSQDGSASVVVTGGIPNYTFKWTKNGVTVGTTAAITNLSSGNYQILVTDANGCTASAVANLNAPGQPCYEGGPVITPNDDGKNDYLVITCIFDFENHLSIYHRNGGLVWETDNYQNNWNGIDEDNEPVADGGYFWVLENKHPGGNVEVLKGTVYLLRTAD